MVVVIADEVMMATAKLFQHGPSQAVQLPQEFRFEGTEVRISRYGDRIILSPAASDSIPWELIDSLGTPDFMAGGREQPDMPEDKAAFEA